MRDNEKIIETLSELGKAHREALHALLDSDAPPWVIGRCIESWRSMQEAINDLGDCGSRNVHAAPEIGLVRSNEDSLMNALAAIEKQLTIMSEVLIQLNDGESDRHES